MASTTQSFDIEVIDPTTWTWIAAARWTNTFENYTWERVMEKYERLLARVPGAGA